jgi:hypothetical protein
MRWLTFREESAKRLPKTRANFSPTGTARWHRSLRCARAGLLNLRSLQSLCRLRPLIGASQQAM